SRLACCTRGYQPLPVDAPSLPAAEWQGQMRFILSMLFCAGAIMLPRVADATELRIGFAAPTSGATSVLGSQMHSGAEFAARSSGAQLIAVDEDCTSEGGESAARTLRDAGVSAVVGF